MPVNNRTAFHFMNSCHPGVPARLDLNLKKLANPLIPLLPGAMNGTWNWVERDLTLITMPASGHFVRQNEAELVTKKMVKWLVD